MVCAEVMAKPAKVKEMTVRVVLDMVWTSNVSVRGSARREGKGWA